MRRHGDRKKVTELLARGRTKVVRTSDLSNLARSLKRAPIEEMTRTTIEGFWQRTSSSIISESGDCDAGAERE